ncbi:MAG: AAA family ATPase [Deltaproteobacteria bacterium]|nr:MAG: AAA family ATPase [Deltaproteobacteria bacterium]
MGNDKEYNNVPDQKELEKELAEYLSKKYGDKVRILSPVVLPKPGPSESGGNKTLRGRDIILNFNIKPKELEAYLDEYIIKQDKAKAILATKVCTHFSRIKYALEHKRDAEVGQIKNNIIMIGPTGVGKTYMIKLIAKKLGVPFVKGDATKFSETGYVGGDVEDLVRDLVQEAGGDMELAQYGIIYIDEIDKIASSAHHLGPDVSRTGVQRALLTPMEETDVDLRVPHDPIAQLEAIERYRKTGKREKRTVNTRNILFIVSGAFNDLADVIKKRLTDQGIGFGAPITSKSDRVDYLRHVKAEDLIEYGFESEFVGRLPVVAVFEELYVEDLYNILKNPGCPVIKGKKHDFKAYGIDITFEDKALHILAEKACTEKTGARGLSRVVEHILLEFEKTLPSTSIRSLVVTPEMIKNPVAELDRLLASPDDPAYIERYHRARERELDIIKSTMVRRQKEIFDNRGLSVTPFRLRYLAELCLTKDIDIQASVEELLFINEEIKDYEATFLDKYGIKIIFEDEAIDQIIGQAWQEGSTAYVVCNNLTESYKYALRIIQDRTGQNVFHLPTEAVSTPEGFISHLIKESFDNSLDNSSK